MAGKAGETKGDSIPLRVAIAQFAPVHLDKQASLTKALELVQRAAERGSQLVAFGETWLAGYPAWLDVCPGAALWENAATKEVFARLRSNSIAVPGEEVETLCEAAGDLKIAIVIGANERLDAGPGIGTLYNALLTFFPRWQAPQPSPEACSHLHGASCVGKWRRAGTGCCLHIMSSHWRTDLLGALDAARAHGHAQFR